MTKQVKIIGISVNEDFGSLKATKLEFNQKNRLTVIKGEVGAGKTTLNRAMRLTTQGSSTLTDKNLYGSDVDLQTQLLDGKTKIFVGCKSNKDGGLDYFLYSLDEDGKKNTNVVLDGVKATPANYLKLLQTSLTWRLDELTSENQTVQKNILLEIYKDKLEKQGVIFDKNHSDYTKGVIHDIEVSKNNRSFMDMKRKEVGGIADDMQKKGIDYENRLKEKSKDDLTDKKSKILAKITLSKTSAEQQRDNDLKTIKIKATEIVSKIKDINSVISDNNRKVKAQKEKLESVFKLVDELIEDSNKNKFVKETIEKNAPKLGDESKEVEFDGSKVKSKPKEFKNNEEIQVLLKDLKKEQKNYKKTKKKDYEKDTSDLEKEVETIDEKINFIESHNKDAKAVNAFHDWRDANENVNQKKKDYYMKLLDIDTGVEGLKICVDEDVDSDENIYLMYDGSYDPKYFHNENKELRKLSSYSGTQKPMICLLIQNQLLKKKPKSLPYLWIDDIPIDKKTRELLKK